LSSTEAWHEGQHDPWPWLRYFTGLLAASYRDFATITSRARSSGTKQDRVREYVLQFAPSEFQIADIRAALPGISDQAIRLVLNSLRDAGLVSV